MSAPEAETPPENVAPPRRARTRHKNRGCLLGCGIVLLGGIVVTIAGAYSMFFAFNHAVTSYLTDQRRPFTASTLSPEAVASARMRVHAFVDAIEAKQTPPELLLTADELNAMLAEFAARENVEIPAHVSFTGDKIHAELSIPLRGLYLNGSGVLDVGLRGGVLMVFANDLEVNGKHPPKELMDLTRNFNLALPFMDDPEVRAVLAKLEYVTVTGGKLKITPKPGATQ